ncbi:MAG TPA: purine-nucleoside phosphorylase [Longimicrobiales bacterium]|nr:purine-nucleoside phosphorylase [Longimicrobiales bacterium]
MSDAAVHARRAAIDEAVAAVRDRSGVKPELAVLWQTHTSALVDALTLDASIEAGDIPGLLPGDGGGPARLLLGTLGKRHVAVLHARLRRYAGHTLQQVVLPVRVLHALGADTLAIVSDCAALRPTWAAGELMLVDDHINLLGDNPLVGPNLDELGPRFPDMSVAYDAQLRLQAERSALAQQTILRRGVYAALEGPNRPTRAEYRMLRAMGADATGTGVVPEVIAARHMSMRVLALAVIAQVALPDALEPLSERQVEAAMQAAEPRLVSLLQAIAAQPNS